MTGASVSKMGSFLKRKLAVREKISGSWLVFLTGVKPTGTDWLRIFRMFISLPEAKSATGNRSRWSISRNIIA